MQCCCFRAHAIRDMEQGLLLCLSLLAGGQLLTHSPSNITHASQQVTARSCVTKGAAIQWEAAAEDTLKLNIPIHTLMDALLTMCTTCCQ